MRIYAEISQFCDIPEIASVSLEPFEGCYFCDLTGSAMRTVWDFRPYNGEYYTGLYAELPDGSRIDEATSDDDFAGCKEGFYVETYKDGNLTNKKWEYDGLI